jgi:opacity protein-like surface antigen
MDAMKARQLLLWAAAAAAAAMAPAVHAQAQDTSSASSTSFLPAKGRGYVGLSLGRSRYSAPCGVTTFNCDSTDNSVQISAGNMVGSFWGVELGYIDMGRISRGGGTTRAQGFNLSMVAKAPVWQSVGVFGKLGTTYGRTETSALLGSGVSNGSDRGFGLSYGAGVSYDFTPRLSATLAWDSNDFRFAGSGRDAVRSTSLGLQYKY